MNNISSIMWLCHGTWSYVMYVTIWAIKAHILCIARLKLLYMASLMQLLCMIDEVILIGSIAIHNVVAMDSQFSQ